LTPLWHLRTLAAEVGIGDILVKDESSRLGLNAFKILGVSYALGSMIKQGQISQGSILACATEGNHGRAVARAASENGIAAKVYMSRDSASSRREAVEHEGAEVIIVDGNYDAAVRMMAKDARNNGWTIVSDTSWPGYEEIPRLVMAGYTRIPSEAETQWLADPPDIVLVQAGVGGLAGAVVSWLCQRFGAYRPFTVICEPLSAACHLESARAGRPVSVPGPFDSILAGLRSGEVSQIAWPIVAAAADAFVAIDDEWCVKTMRLLAHPAGEDQRIEAGASGACGLATLLAILQDQKLRRVREASRLAYQSRALVINTEGATDMELYRSITGNETSLSP
jgi:diaminopropionate ammonia-lyase